MTEIKDTKVTISYKKDMITISGEGVEYSLEISSSELRKMFWGKNGSGILSVKLS